MCKVLLFEINTFAYTLYSCLSLTQHTKVSWLPSVRKAAPGRNSLVQKFEKSHAALAIIYTGSINTKISEYLGVNLRTDS